MRYKLTGELLDGKRFLSSTVIEWNFEKGKWLCRCDCGKEKFLATSDLKKSKIGCKCLVLNKLETKYSKIVGTTHKEITCISYKYVPGKGAVLFCKCSCGTDLKIIGSNWRRRRSCGCHPNTSNLKHRFVDISGKKIGHLIVKEWNSELQRWLCDCDCGNSKYLPAYDLKKGTIISCGCARKRRMHIKCKELIGKKKFYLKCLGYEYQNNRVTLKCRCKCGTHTIIQKSHWEKTQSCGCLTQDLRGENSGNAKLTNEQAQLIRKLYRGKSGFNLTVLSNMFGVNVGIISRVVKDISYKNVE